MTAGILGVIPRAWHNRWGKQLIALVGGFAFFWGAMQLYIASPIRFLYNDTRSQPRGIYLLSVFPNRHSTLRVGERVDFRYVCPLLNGHCVFYTEAPYSTGNQAMKQVGAIPGDTLNVVGQNVFMHTPGNLNWKLLGRRYVYIPGIVPPRKVYTYAEKSWRDYVIPKGEFYGMSQRVKASFDSRYYGLDHYSQLIGETTLLWRVDLNPIFDTLNNWLA